MTASEQDKNRRPILNPNLPETDDERRVRRERQEAAERRRAEQEQR